MKINGECKASIVHPTKDYISRVVNYLPYCAKCMENLKNVLFPEASVSSSFSISILTSDPKSKKSIANRLAQVCLMVSKQFLPVNTATHELSNSFSMKPATPSQQHDLLQFRNIGQEEYKKYVEYYILKKVSVHPPQRKKRLQTLSETRSTKRQISQLERDRRLVQKCLHKKMKWSKQTGQPVDKIAEQYIPIPLALADSNGYPIKGQKSNTTKALKSRYKDAQPAVFLNKLPKAWTLVALS